MAAFIEKSDVAEQSEHFCVGLGAFQPHLKAITYSQGHSSRLQLMSPEICNFLTGRDTPANDRNIYSAGAVINSFIPKGGDDAMG